MICKKPKRNWEEENRKRSLLSVLYDWRYLSTYLTWPSTSNVSTKKNLPYLSLPLSLSLWLLTFSPKGTQPCQTTRNRKLPYMRSRKIKKCDEPTTQPNPNPTQTQPPWSFSVYAEKWKKKKANRAKQKHLWTQSVMSHAPLTKKNPNTVHTHRHRRPREKKK